MTRTFRRHGGASLVLLITLFVAAPARAQGSYSADDVKAGGVMFGQMCVVCHGFNGTGGMGPPLTRPKLLNAPDDAALRVVISDGIPDRGMPRVRRTTPEELRQLVAYVRSLPRRPRRSGATRPRARRSTRRPAAPTATWFAARAACSVRC